MKFSTWSFELNLIRQFGENQYIFLGPTLTLWDMNEYDDADAAIGVNFGHGITVDQNAVSKLLFEYGFKIYRGTLTRISRWIETGDEIGFRSLSFFVKFGHMIDFLSE